MQGEHQQKWSPYTLAKTGDVKVHVSCCCWHLFKQMQRFQAWLFVVAHAKESSFNVCFPFSSWFAFCCCHANPFLQGEREIEACADKLLLLSLPKEVQELYLVLATRVVVSCLWGVFILLACLTDSLMTVTLAVSITLTLSTIMPFIFIFPM